MSFLKRSRNHKGKGLNYEHQQRSDSSVELAPPMVRQYCHLCGRDRIAALAGPFPTAADKLKVAKTIQFGFDTCLVRLS